MGTGVIPAPGMSFDSFSEADTPMSLSDRSAGQSYVFEIIDDHQEAIITFISLWAFWQGNFSWLMAFQISSKAELHGVRSQLCFGKFFW